MLPRGVGGARGQAGTAGSLRPLGALAGQPRRLPILVSHENPPPPTPLITASISTPHLQALAGLRLKGLR